MRRLLPVGLLTFLFLSIAPISAQNPPPRITADNLHQLVEVGSLTVENSQQENIEFSANGDWILIPYRLNWDDVEAVLWNLNTSQQRAKFHGPVIFTPDGGSLAVGRQSGTVAILDAYTLEEKGRFDTGKGQPISVLTFSADGQQLAIGDEVGNIVVWDVFSNTSQIMNCPRNSFMYYLHFLHRDRLLLSPCGGIKGEIWNLSTFTSQIDVWGIDIYSASVSQDNQLLAIGGTRLLSASSVGGVHVYDLSTNELLTVLGTVWSMYELPDLPDFMATEQPFNFAYARHPHINYVYEARFVNDKVLVSASSDAVRVWDVSTAIENGIGVRISHIEGVEEQLYGFNLPDAGKIVGEGLHYGGLGQVAFSPREPLLVFSDDNGDTHFWDFSNPYNIQERVEKLGKHGWTFSPDGALLLGGKDVGFVSSEDFYIRDMQTQAQILPIPAVLDISGRILFTPDGTRLIIRDEDTIHILQVG